MSGKRPGGTRGALRKRGSRLHSARGSAAAFLAIVAVAVLIVVSGNKTSGGDTNLEDVGLVEGQLQGIPQNGMVLGDPQAKVTLIEFGDLQCPVCKGFSEEIIPERDRLEGAQRRSEDRVPQLHDHQPGIDPRRGGGDRRRRAGARLELTSSSSTATRGPRTPATSPTHS